MKLTCPACGAQASADAWVADAEARRALQIVATLPRDVARLALPYLSLFRPQAPGRGLFWGRACKLLEQLKALVEAPEISWERRPHHPNSPDLWARAMDKLLAKPPEQLPLRNHNYLRAIAYELADRAAKCPRFEIPDKPREAAFERIPERELAPADLMDRAEAVRRVKELIESIAKKGE